MTISTTLNDLKTLFNKVSEVYYKSTPITKSVLTAQGGLTVDMELPVLEDGVNFDTGTADITEIKLTTGAVWTSKANKGDSDISFQVASVAGDVNDLFMEKKEDIASVTTIVNGVTYSGAGYSLAPHKVTGSLLLKAEDGQTVIILPSVEMYANFIGADGDNPAYFNVAVTPLENADGEDIIILAATA